MVVSQCSSHQATVGVDVSPTVPESRFRSSSRTFRDHDAAVLAADMPAVEGLVHISELAERHVEIPEQVVQVGDEILVKVIDIDLDRQIGREHV